MRGNGVFLHDQFDFSKGDNVAGAKRGFGDRFAVEKRSPGAFEVADKQSAVGFFDEETMLP